ncbi:hypothetical protein HOA59_01700 [archaeon]|jgi:hypothetical protein|nr:hypothetical protein [archaeon]MBT6824130.1 hypothetical protein [archaeon]MBT7107026.1 hypothetical protein [archaeon]MBT7297638.1 hypothetical protein [archaeon]
MVSILKNNDKLKTKLNSELIKDKIDDYSFAFPILIKLLHYSPLLKKYFEKNGKDELTKKFK